MTIGLEAGTSSSWNELAPPGPGQKGRVVGLVPALKFAGDVLAPTAGLLLQRAARRRLAAAQAGVGAKDFNDQPAPHIPGSTQGLIIKQSHVGPGGGVNVGNP